jgi:hypothetical protein
VRLIAVPRFCVTPAGTKTVDPVGAGSAIKSKPEGLELDRQRR